MNKIISILLLGLIISTSGCSNKTVLPDSQAEVKKVKILTAKMQNIKDFYKTSGTIISKQRVDISSKIMGNITGVLVDEGSLVKKGQLLITIDDKELKTKKFSAEANFQKSFDATDIAREEKKLAEITYNRYKNIYEQNALTKQELDEIEVKKKIAESNFNINFQNFKAAKGNLQEIKENLAYTKIYAPFTGVVTAKNIEIGQMAIPGKPLVSIEKQDSLELIANIDEQLLNKINVGDEILVDTSSASKVFSSKITDVIPSVNIGSRMFKIKAAIENQNIKSGTYAEIKIATGTKKGIFVPSDIVVKKGQLEGVYVLNNNKVMYRLIKTGQKFDKSIEVLSGLNEGDRVIVNHIYALSDGVLAEVENNE